MAERAGPLHEVLDSREAAERVVRWIHRTYTNEHTNQDYRTALRSFVRYHDRLADLDDRPSVNWIPTGTSNDFNPVPSERDLLLYEDDIRPLVDAATNARDAAITMVQFEAGARGGELYDMRVGDVFDGEYSMGIHVDGKRGERAIHLVVSVPFLTKWLGEHPAPDDPEAPLWSKLGKNEQPTYQNVLGIFRRLAKRAGIQKDVTPTNFRKSNTRWLTVQGMSTARIEDRQGRVRGSKHTARYHAHFGEESQEVAYAALHGIAVESEQPEDMQPLPCPRCGKDTPRDRENCVWCHQALTPEGTEAVEETVSAAVEEMTAEDSKTHRLLFSEFISFVNENPHMLPRGTHQLSPPDSGADAASSSSSSSE
jgi:integrase